MEHLVSGGPAGFSQACALLLLLSRFNNVLCVGLKKSVSFYVSVV